ncbi:MAG: hypothetical protein JSU00_21385 [Acidobacteria bacterium]|nr:hypothetical protein [Acidobacteriota bacterium]
MTDNHARSPQILALADDLTGALETGAQLAAEGLEALVCARPPFDASAEAVVLNLETRHLSASAAEQRVREAVALRRNARIYLKTDSTLRGSIAESLRALKDEFPGRAIAYIPAYPAMGRTVRHGVLYVDGVPLAETAFARDPLNPIRSSSVVDLAAGIAVVHDGENEQDLVASASALAPSAAIIAGTAGFVGHWVRSLGLTRLTRPITPKASSGLIVVGSRHPVAIAQAKAAAGAPAWPLFQLPSAILPDPLEVAAAAAAQVRQRLEATPDSALIVVGGDTAAAILKELGCRTARPIGELLPGVPVSRIEALGRSFTLVTKAGGFGNPQTLLHIIEKLQ